MKCDICGKEIAWLSYIGSDTVCAKCIAKHTIFKEMRFSDEKRLHKVLRKRKPKNFEELKSIDDDEYENIMLAKDDPEYKKYKEKEKKEDDDLEVPVE